MKLAVVTDSSAYLPERIKNHPDLFVIPIPLIMDGKIYNEGIDIEADEYYGLLKNSKDFPTTSQPVVGEVLALYEELKEKGYFWFRQHLICDERRYQWSNGHSL